jgi:hypothetical protein
MNSLEKTWNTVLTKIGLGDPALREQVLMTACFVASIFAIRKFGSAILEAGPAPQ